MNISLSVKLFVITTFILGATLSARKTYASDELQLDNDSTVIISSGSGADGSVEGGNSFTCEQACDAIADAMLFSGYLERLQYCDSQFHQCRLDRSRTLLDCTHDHLRCQDEALRWLITHTEGDWSPENEFRKQCKRECRQPQDSALEDGDSLSQA